jgi:uncharacterized protein involved in outer membrane biogenesis
MSRWVKRLLWSVVTVVVAVAAIVLLIYWLLPRDTLKTQVAEQIAAWTGRDVSVAGEPEITLFPGLTVTLDTVEVSGPDGMADADLLSMDRLKGRIRLLPLLIGQVEIDSFTMVRPVLHLVRDEKGRRNWAFNSGAAALQLAFSGDVPLGLFRLEDGTITYENRQAGDREQLDSVNLALTWPSVRKALSIEGSGIWRGEQVTFDGAAAKPFSYISGSGTPLSAMIEAAPFSMRLDGTASDYPHLHVGGGLTLSSPSLRRFLTWLGKSVTPGTTLGQASLTGTADLSDDVLSMQDARLTLDGNMATGALRIVTGAKPDFTGTLAFGALDLSPYFAGLSNAVALGPDWHRVALPTGWLANADADIRLSAETVKIGALDAGNTAASASLRDGRLEIGIAHAAFDQGSLSGNLAITKTKAAPTADATAQLRAMQVDLADVAPALRLPAGTSGTASLVVDLAAQGNTLGALLGALGGTARLEVQQAKVPLLGLDAIAAGSAPTPPASAVAPVHILSAAATATILNGVAAIDHAEAAADAYSAVASGSVRLGDGGLDLQGTLTPGTPAQPSGGAIPFVIEGTLASPSARLRTAAE